MREFRTRLGSKGQATIPIEVRKLLGVAPHDQLSFVVEDDGEIRVMRSPGPMSVIARTAGALRHNGPAYTAEEERKLAEIAIAEDAMARLED